MWLLGKEQLCLVCMLNNEKLGSVCIGVDGCSGGEVLGLVFFFCWWKKERSKSDTCDKFWKF